MTIENKRRAIFTVLSDVLSDTSLWEVMWHWQENYSDKPQFELNHFLGDCLEVPEIAENRSWLYRQLIGILMDRNTELKDDPWPQMLDYQTQLTGVPTQVSATENWGPVFTQVMTSIMSGLRSDSQYTLGKYLSDYLIKSDADQELKDSFRLWIAERTELNTSQMDVYKLKRLLNVAYIAICELLGPVKADKILSNAINETHSMFPDSNTDPRLLL